MALRRAGQWRLLPKTDYPDGAESLKDFLRKTAGVEGYEFFPAA
jgi:hypothetical protein